MHNYGGYIALLQISQINLNNGMQQKTSVEIHSFFCYVYGFQCNIFDVDMSYERDSLCFILISCFWNKETNRKLMISNFLH